MQVWYSLAGMMWKTIEEEKTQTKIQENFKKKPNIKRTNLFEKYKYKKINLKNSNKSLVLTCRYNVEDTG